MKGWKRLGIVMSVIWFVSFFGYAVVSASNEQDERHLLFVGNCYRQYDWNTQRAEEEKCEERAPPWSPLIWERDDLSLIAEIDLAIIAVGWLIGWLVLSTVRWIAQGFT